MKRARKPVFDPKAFLAKANGGRTISNYQKDQTVFSQGDAADAVFYIQQGKIKIIVVSERGKEAVVAILGTGDFCGEGCLTGQPQRIGTAIAMTDCVAVMARRSFVQAGTNVQPWKPSLTLVTGGVFAWMRNPMYLGLGLLTAGIAIMLASGWTLALIVPAALVLHHGVVLREERYLEAKFSDEYRRYRESVPRYGWQIPGTRRSLKNTVGDGAAAFLVFAPDPHGQATLIEFGRRAPG